MMSFRTKVDGHKSRVVLLLSGLISETFLYYSGHQHILCCDIEIIFVCFKFL